MESRWGCKGLDSKFTFLLVDDEPLILMDLEFAVEDQGHDFCSAGCVQHALEAIDSDECPIDVAILDFTLPNGSNCVPIARKLDDRGIPYVIHSGDLQRRDEAISKLDARMIAKPAPSEKVIEAAIAELSHNRAGGQVVAAG